VPTRAHRRSPIANITKPADGEGKFIRQSAAAVQYGHACVKIAPNEKGKGIEIENKICRRRHSQGIHPGRHRRHRRRRSKAGVLASYQMIDVEGGDRGRHVPVKWSSTSWRSRLAGIFAFQGRRQEGRHDPARAHHEGRSRHPRMNTRGTCSATSPGAAGTIVGIEAKSGQTIINAHRAVVGNVRLRHRLRSLSKGRASYSMNPSASNRCPSASETPSSDAARQGNRRRDPECGAFAATMRISPLTRRPCHSQE